jgi:hypothetical protein
MITEDIRELTEEACEGITLAVDQVVSVIEAWHWLSLSDGLSSFPDLEWWKVYS